MGESISAWRQYLRTVLRNPWTIRILRFVLVPALLLCSLWLPPISLGVRVFHTDYPLISRNGGSVGLDGGARLTVEKGALSGQLRLLLKPLNTTERAVAPSLKAVPGGLAVRGQLYRFAAYGSRPKEALFVAPLPADATNPDALDLYAWTGRSWQWVPSVVSAGERQIKATLTAIPRMLATMETAPRGLAVGIVAPEVAAVNAAPLDLASELYVAGLSLNESGAVEGELALESAPANLLVLPTLSNRVKGIARTDWVANLVANRDTRTAHVKAIVAAVQKGGYKGLSLEYEALDSELRDAFSSFVGELAADLHKSGRLLIVRVDEPRIAEDGSLQTDGYEWAALGRVADLLRIPALGDPAAYNAGGAMEQGLRAAVAEVDRQKVQLIVSANCYQQVGDKRQPLVYGDALSLASQNLVAEGGDTFLPGQTVAVQLPNLGSGLREDAGSCQAWFAFRDSGGAEHKVWIENSNSAACKIALAGQFCLHGVAVEDLAGTANDARIWDTVRIARAPSTRGSQSIAGAAASRYSVVWKVRSEDGQLVQEGANPASQPVVTFTAAEDPGEYTVSVAISEDGGKTTMGEPRSLTVNVPTPTPSPVPTNTPTPRPTAPPAPAGPPPAPRPSAGYGFGYGIQVDMVTDTNYDRILGAVQQLGFGWIKQQVEWYRYNPGPGQYDWGRLDAIVDACSARGIRVLFSVVKAPTWSRPPDDDKSEPGPPADPNTYGEYLRQMAARYKGRVQAYEIWNEENMAREWGGLGNRLNAAKYVNLLKVAYTAIKSVDPGAMVISGAPTPTGWSDGNVAIDDQLYLRQMYDAGLKSWCDAVGVHPSGYNNPPDADWRTFTDPSCGFRGPQDNRHPSWYFRATMEGYRNIMIQYGDGNKRLVPTEFGWAAVDGLGVPPARGYEYASDNTAQEQAQFIVRAFQMGKNWGFVGPMFLWNLNFGPVAGAADEKAAFGVVDPGWGARPAYNALVGMPK